MPLWCEHCSKLKQLCHVRLISFVERLTNDSIDKSIFFLAQCCVLRQINIKEIKISLRDEVMNKVCKQQCLVFCDPEERRASIYGAHLTRPGAQCHFRVPNQIMKNGNILSSIVHQYQCLLCNCFKYDHSQLVLMNINKRIILDVGHLKNKDNL